MSRVGPSQAPLYQLPSPSLLPCQPDWCQGFHRHHRTLTWTTSAFWRPPTGSMPCTEDYKSRGNEGRAQSLQKPPLTWRRPTQPSACFAWKNQCLPSRADTPRQVSHFEDHSRVTLMEHGGHRCLFQPQFPADCRSERPGASQQAVGRAAFRLDSWVFE